MPSAKWIKPSRLPEIDDMMTAAVYEQRTRWVHDGPFDAAILPVNMPVAMKLRAVFIEQLIEAFESLMRQIFHITVTATWCVSEKDIKPGLLFFVSALWILSEDA